VIKGFKEFIMRGNVIDLAVAVVIGAAFTAVVNAIVATIITPLISLFFQADAMGVPGITINGIYGQPVTFPIGDLISAIISFFAVALVVYFVFVVPMNHFKERQAAKAGIVEDTEEKLPTESELLMQIRDLLEASQTPVNQAPTNPAPKL